MTFSVDTIYIITKYILLLILQRKEDEYEEVESEKNFHPKKKMTDIIQILKTYYCLLRESKTAKWRVLLTRTYLSIRSYDI